MATVAGVSWRSGVPGGEAVGGMASVGGTGGAAGKGDTVRLSASSQIHSMKQSGESAKQTAPTLGMTEAQVGEALGIATSGGSAKASEVAALFG